MAESACRRGIGAHETRTVNLPNAKYPKTPYWPFSPAVGRGDVVHSNPGRFVGVPVVVTEKLDGGNTLLHAGSVYGRSVSAPSEGKWMAMVKKHHAWKVTEPDIYLYGEDIFGLHSIEYEPVPEHKTFHAFALRNGRGAFASFSDLEAYTRPKMIPVVPILFKGKFQSLSEIRAFVERAHAEPSALGGEREGVVLRLERGFPAQKFSINVCKSVRTGHVQTDEHWTRKWRPCKIARANASVDDARVELRRTGLKALNNLDLHRPQLMDRETQPWGAAPLALGNFRRTVSVEAMPRMYR